MVLGRLPLYGEPEVSPDCSQASSLSAEEIVVVYHERTKHHYHRFAASVGYMDWATQPDPFRCYEGASLVRLPFPDMGQALPYWQLYAPTAWSQPRFRLTPSRWSSATPSR
jgi:hypothetical protein